MTQRLRHAHIFLLFVLLAFTLPLPIRAQDGDIRQLVRQAADAAVRRDYRQSADLLFRARSKAEAENNYEQLFWIYTNLGINQAELLNYADALQNFTKAYQIALDHLDKRSVLSIRNNIAGLYMMNHENAKALGEYRKIYADARNSRDSVLLGGCALNIATILVGNGQYTQATSYMAQAEKLLGKDPSNTLSLLTLQTDYLLGTQQAEKAYTLLQRACTGAAALSPHPQLVMLQARAALHTGRYAEAEQQAHRALASQGVDLAMKRAIFELLSRTLSAQQRYKEALQYKDSVQSVADTLTSVTGQKLFEARQIQFDIWQKQQEIDNYHSRHKLEMAIMALAALAVLVLAWALMVQRRNNRQQHKLTALELEHEQQQRQMLQEKIAQEQANRQREKEQSQRTIEQRGRELMSQALQAANRNDTLRDLLAVIDADPSLQHTANPQLTRTLSALRHQLDASTEWKDFTTYFEQANKHFIEELQTRHPQLTPADLRYLALIYINLSSKEIALLLNITPEYSKKKKQNMARKLGLNSTQSMYEYLRSI